jgi:hypothetical protein
MKTDDVKGLRESVAQLYPKRDRGDLRERDFQAKVAEQTVALYRAVITKRMAEGETIECEHHTIWTHFRLMQSVLREPAQQATSLFLTDRRLYRLQSTIMPEQPPTADSRDQTTVDVISLDGIHALKKHSEIRIGEMVVGAAMFGIGIIFHDWLSITGPFLAGLGILGVLHALLWPTRWMEVEIEKGSTPPEPILIYGLKKKSAKELVRRLQDKLRTPCPQ